MFHGLIAKARILRDAGFLGAGNHRRTNNINDTTINDTMKYAIKRNDGKLFPEKYATRLEAENELKFKLGNGATYGLAWVVEIN